MIIIININRESFHYFEFIKPIEDILNRVNTKYITVNYKDCTDTVVFRADRVIIAGTSLKDNGFLDDVNDFYWIKNFNKPILGICGGMHLLGLVFDGVLTKQQEIGLTEIKFRKKCLGMNDTVEVYELHNYYVESSDFEICATSKHCPQIIQHKIKPFFGVLFHPEVRNKRIIEYFLNTAFN
jgi:GMP synthase (glutamine-hydrolysing)